MADAAPTVAPAVAAAPSIVKFKDVTKTYAIGTKREYTAIKNVTFDVPDLPGIGELVTILGPSGCGKSTVLKQIAGLEPQHPPTSGEVHLYGKPVLGPGADRGMVFQEYTAFDNRTVVENIAFGLECRGMPRNERMELATEWVGKVGLDPKRDTHKYPSQLSGGMRQRVAIARSLILRPRILLMDEPFGALDPMTRLRMQDLLVHLWREIHPTIFFVTHSLEEGVYLGDRVYLFSAAPGTIVEELTVPPPDRPALVMQSEPEFIEKVRYVRDRIAKIEESAGIKG
jgi:NitT/TauT family transport system ATP-binding protein